MNKRTIIAITTAAAIATSLKKLLRGNTLPHAMGDPPSRYGQVARSDIKI
jgi:hypothetical protein